MGTTIRRAKSADAPALAELASVTFPLACPPGSAPEDVQAFIARMFNATSFARYMEDPARVLFVAEEAPAGGGLQDVAAATGGPRLLAYTMLVDVPPSDADVAAVVNEPRAVELSKFYAHPDVHGTGVAASLMAASLEWAAARGAVQMWLGVNSENLRARKFYEKHGFSVAGSRSFHLGNQIEHDHVMMRPVQGLAQEQEDMNDFQIEQLRVPDTLNGEGSADFLRAVEVSRQVRVATWGNADLAYTAEEMLALCHDPYEWYVMLVARLNGQIVGRAGVAMPLDDHTELAHVTLDVLPSAEGCGLGRRLLEAAETFVRGENRRVVVVETNHSAAELQAQQQRGGGGGSLRPATGVGALPMENRQARFAHHAGYHLERVEQFSSCALPFPEGRAAELLASASAAHGDEYEVHQWTDSCPKEWAVEVARLEQSMDVSAGDGNWDVSRMREAEEISRATGRHTLVTAAEHRESGRLVGYTSISVLGSRDDVVFQDETVMDDGHRGRQLGLRLKLANLELLARDYPKSHAIYTWNAAEDVYLININDRMGFAAAGVTGQWRKSLDPEE